MQRFQSESVIEEEEEKEITSINCKLADQTYYGVVVRVVALAGGPCCLLLRSHPTHKGDSHCISFVKP